MRQIDGGKETCGTQGGLYESPEKRVTGYREVTLNIQKSAEVILAEKFFFFSEGPNR